MRNILDYIPIIVIYRYPLSGLLSYHHQLNLSPEINTLFVSIAKYVVAMSLLWTYRFNSTLSCQYIQGKERHAMLFPFLNSQR